MPIHTRKNQYRGVNAHLMSYLQDEPSRWTTFHSEHIAHLRTAIDALLPDGYFVLNEQSLQLTELNLMTGELGAPRTRMDVAVYRERPEQAISASGSVAGVADLPAETVRVAETLAQEEYLRTPVIAWVNEDGALQPVTRLELLSPSNKPPGSHTSAYLAKRNDTLRAGINLVEMDYLHQQRSALSILASYPQREAKAYPYVILVSTPLPSLDDGQTAIYGFHADERLPVINIPLKGTDFITLNVGEVYNRTFGENRYYHTRVVDYTAPPLNFDRYSAADQARILARMKTVQRAVERGELLDNPPLPLED